MQESWRVAITFGTVGLSLALVIFFAVVMVKMILEARR